jgi:hypothetical protein
LRIKFSQRVRVRVPDLPPDIPGQVIAGPSFKSGRALFKIHHDELDFDNWYPVEWLTPVVAAVR